jgi:UDP-N-acetylmuramoylalanine--D-glutamate ligase
LPCDCPVTSLSVAVIGMDAAGFACADALLERGDRVLVVEQDDAGDARRERLEILRTLGAELSPPQRELPDCLDVVVVPRAAETVRAAQDGGGVRVPVGAEVWTETEVAWRVRPGPAPALWLLIAGPDPGAHPAGTAGLAALTAAVLNAGGLRAVVAGGPDRPLVEALRDPRSADVLVVDLGDDPLQRAGRAAVHSAVPVASMLYGGGAAERAPSALGRVFEGTRTACLYDTAVPATEAAVREADVQEGCRAVGVTLGVPAPSFLGVVDEVLCDRAFVPDRTTSAAELCTTDQVRAAFGGAPDPLHLRLVLSAAALARAAGVAPGAVRAALAG